MQVNSTAKSADAVANSTNSQDNSIPVPTQMLSEQDFLNLLVTQMTAQDPLNPINNQDMLTQMVQFSTLSANTNLQTQLSQMQTDAQFSDANALIGKQVTVQVDSSGNTVQGVVSGLNLSSGAPQIVINGQSYFLGQVSSISNATTAQTSTTAN